MKVMTIVGTRREIIRLSQVMTVLNRQVEHVVVDAGQNPECGMDRAFWEELGLRRADIFLGSAGGNGCETIGLLIAKIDDVLRHVTPDAVLVCGETDSSLAAYPARRRRIPVVHLGAGNRWTDDGLPGSINARIIDHISDLNVVHSRTARESLASEGIPEERVVETEDPLREALAFYLPKSAKSLVLSQLNVVPGEYFVVNVHEAIEARGKRHIERLMETVNGLAEEYGKPVVTTARAHLRAEMEGEKAGLHKRVKVHKPFLFFDYLQLQMNTRAAVSDNEMVLEESGILGFPTVFVGNGMKGRGSDGNGMAVPTDLEWAAVKDAVGLLDERSKAHPRGVQADPNGAKPKVSEQVAGVILDFVAEKHADPLPAASRAGVRP